ncbi:hypothetical protein Pmar_PMAR000096 [Perkinsus marinus ATCC 50983]|uniref:Uncharacterized protein n=1 Tax=Perkinsus marinus (strain ATCC 50983 / TXsc) TaxID=423536 RepID=C5KPW2_PERM5|nr:hypothetical protein Pmar_PMAR000096 [Perkinsus marinus ATCC 50983]EER13509.1 hypothetical protein Pmar_PMAR000096 [Perkinsus marinus ATCC 50983]|eukprot:XP_002781714.1 hypothetical protein Pmar_PMAR000096 [Perkinsus marinus ATCC 50983]
MDDFVVAGEAPVLDVVEQLLLLGWELCGFNCPDAKRSLYENQSKLSSSAERLSLGDKAVLFNPGKIGGSRESKLSGCAAQLVRPGLIMCSRMLGINAIV